MNSDTEAVNRTAMELGIGGEDVLQALRICSTYERLLQRLKSQRKAIRQKAIAQQQLEKEKSERPDWCFCEGVMERKYEDDGIIEHVTSYGHYDFNRKHPYQQPIFRCSRCGKKYWYQPAMA